MRSNAVLIRHPEQGWCVVEQRVNHETVFLRHLHPLHPVRCTLAEVLLDEPLRRDPSREALEREGPHADVWEHQRSDYRVVVSELTLRYPIVREEHFVRVRDIEDHGTSRTT